MTQESDYIKNARALFKRREAYVKDLESDSVELDVALETIASLRRKVATLKQLRIADWNRIRAERERAEKAETKGKQDEGLVELLVNAIDGHEWLAQGRGPYAYDDGRYDDEVMRFVQHLLDLLPGGKWQPWQNYIDQLEHDSGELQAEREKSALMREALREAMAIAIRDGRASAFVLKKPLRDQSWYDKATHALVTPSTEPKADLGMYCSICQAGGHDISWHTETPTTEEGT